MSNDIPIDLRYTESHEWARADKQGVILVGITDYAQHLFCLLYTSPSPRDGLLSRMPSSA